MKTILRKTLSMFLALSLLGSLAPAAAASDALGEDLTARDTLLNQDTQLSTNVFWSTAYSDLRTENIITYSPNDDVTPIVTFGDTLTSRTTVSTAAKELESQGYRVVAGINGDFFNTSNGLPIGILVSDGQLLSSDGGYYAVGFKEDGSAVIGKPGVTVTADLGYELVDSSNYATEVVRTIAGVNKARVSSGGIYLYTYDFNDRHTTGTNEAGVDVLCSIEDGDLAIGSSLTLTVERVIESSGTATSVGRDQVVLSANAQASTYYTDALRNIPAGAEITITVTAADEAWNDVVYAAGALYSLLENGAVPSGLPSGVSPRTAIGVKADGTVVFYTIDGRRSGHSIGASLSQVGQRLAELGCVTAVGLDGGGSTTITVTQPDETAAATINRPSDGSERSVTNHFFLVATSDPSGSLSHFYVQADYDYVLAGSQVEISAAAVDTHYIPMDSSYDLEASAGELEDHILTTPARGGDITVTASRGSREGTTTVHAIAEPTDVAIRNASGTILTSLSVTAGSSTQLTGSAAWNHISLKADPEAFAWSVSGNIGTIDEHGLFTATAPGTGTITATAGGRSATVEVTVSSAALQTVEDFEDDQTIFSNVRGGTLSITSNSNDVRMGQGAGRLDYTLDAYNSTGTGYITELWIGGDLETGPYNQLNLWVYGDGSGLPLSLLYFDGTRMNQELLVTNLDFTGWKQVTVSLAGVERIDGLQLSREMDITTATSGGSGTIYLDQMVLAFTGVADNAVPSISLTPSGGTLTASISDAVDGVLPESAVSVTVDGAEQTFTYNAETGALSTALVSDGRPHRITVTARDASGNIGRASYDVPVSDDWTPVFTDTQGYWAATYVDFLYDAGITTGYSDSTFRPNANISRQQFAVMLFRYLGLDGSQYESVTLPFADTASIGDYALTAVKALYTEGIINGSTGADGRLYFNPGSSLTRAQAAAMIGRTQEKGYATVELTFSDAASIPSYAAYYIQTMAAQGVIGGYGDGTFRPNANITRGQMAKILYNLM